MRIWSNERRKELWRTMTIKRNWLSCLVVRQLSTLCLWHRIRLRRGRKSLNSAWKILCWTSLLGNSYQFWPRWLWTPTWSLSSRLTSSICITWQWTNSLSTKWPTVNWALICLDVWLALIAVWLTKTSTIGKSTTRKRIRDSLVLKINNDIIIQIKTTTSC